MKEELRDMQLDFWQRRVINNKGNIVLRTGRQVGKSTVVAIKAYKLALEYPGTTTLVIAASQRQSSLLFEKIKGEFELDNRERIEKAMKGQTFSNLTAKRKFEKEHSIYDDEPTLTRMRLKNGSTIYCIPTGRTGAFIRGFTVDFLIADEAAYIEEAVWVAVTPMMATSEKQRGTGWIILLSTPKGKSGFFYQCCYDKSFLHIHVNSEKCSRIKRSFLTKERKRLTKMEYAQEYKGEFMEGYNQYFPTEAIKSCATLNRYNFSEEHNRLYNSYFLGVDVARYGGDESAFSIIEVNRRTKLIRGVHFEEFSRKAVTETIGKVLELNKKWKFTKIYIDSGGVGGGVADVLIEKLRKKVVETDNASRSRSQDKHSKLLKEDMYSNLLVQMEQGTINFLKYPKLISSLRGITYEFKSDGSLKISGRGSHLAEAFVRSCWGIKDTNKRLFLG